VLALSYYYGKGKRSGLQEREGGGRLAFSINSYYKEMGREKEGEAGAPFFFKQKKKGRGR